MTTSLSEAEPRAVGVGKWLFALVVPASALAIGSVPTTVLVVVSVVAAVSCALLWSHLAVGASRSSRAVLSAMAVLVGMTALQVVPLPASLVGHLAPSNADVWSRALSAFREPGPLWHPISLAPWASRVELLKGLLYATTFLGALRIASLRDGERFLLRLVIVASCAVCLSSLAHAAVSAERVFGVYRPRQLWAYRAGRFSPLLNTNHLAAYANVGACVALGALFSPALMPRSLAVSAMVLCAGVSFLQASRAATVSLLLGVLVILGLSFTARRRLEPRHVRVALYAACSVAVTFLVVLSLSDNASHLVSRDLIKVSIARDALSLMQAAPWFGTGRGAFESVFSSVRRGASFVTFSNPEDLFVQWLVEWGLPVSVVALGLFAWALRPSVVQRAARPQFGVWVAIVVTVVHELADYHLEVPGIAVLVVVCVALVAGGRIRTPSSPAVLAPRTLRRVSLATAIVTAVLAVFIGVGGDRSLVEARERTSAMAVDPNVGAEAFSRAVRQAMLDFPGEPFFPLMGAARAQTTGEGSVLPWVARALDRNPRYGRAHFLLARSLARSHPAQARLEYRLAYENDESLREAIARAAVRLVEDVPSALELIPEGEVGAGLLESLTVSIAPVMPSTAWSLDVEALSRTPDALAPLRRQADAALADLTPAASWCSDRSVCLRVAEDLASQLVRREPNQCSAHVRVAQLRLKRGKGEVASALDALGRAVETVDDRAYCLRQLIQFSLENGERRRAEIVLERLIRSGCGDAASCVDLYSWAAATEASMGHALSAVFLYRRASALAPDRDDLLLRIGQLGEQHRALADAVDAYSTLASRHPDDPAWPAKLASLRQRVLVESRPSLPVDPGPSGGP